MCWKIAFFSTQNIEKKSNNEASELPPNQLGHGGLSKTLHPLNHIRQKKKNWQDFQVRWIIQIIFQ